MKKFYILSGFVLVLVLLWSGYRSDVPIETLRDKYLVTGSAFYSFQGMEVHYSDEGEGPTLFLLHGTGASLHTWEPWKEKFIAEGYRVVRLDLPAYGLTGGHPTGDYSLDMYLGLLEGLHEHLELDSVVMMGNSFGGLLSWQYATRHPEHIKSLVLIDPAGAPQPKGEDHKPPMIFRLAKTKGVGEFLVRITPKSIIRRNLKQVYHQDSLLREETVDRYYDLTLREGNRQAFVDRVRNPRKPEGWSLISTIIAPTLILWGQHDSWISVDNAEAFHQAMPNSQLHIFPNLGHVPMEEDPEGTFPRVVQFLNR